MLRGIQPHAPARRQTRAEHVPCAVSQQAAGYRVDKGGLPVEQPFDPRHHEKTCARNEGRDGWRQIGGPPAIVLELQSAHAGPEIVADNEAGTHEVQLAAKEEGADQGGGDAQYGQDQGDPACHPVNRIAFPAGQYDQTGKDGERTGDDMGDDVECMEIGHETSCRGRRHETNMVRFPVDF